jgi:opacity protein-like surface antigen
VNVPVNGNTSAQVQWVPPTTGHLCVKAEIYHNEDTNGANNAGQENCHVGPTSSPLSVTFSVRNPSDEARALHYEVRQLTPAGERKKSILWNTTIKHPDPQVLQPGDEAEVTVTVDPDYTYVKPGEKAEFAVTNYLDREIIGGVNLTATRRAEKYQVSIHGGMVNPLAIMAEYFTSGLCFMADFGYSISPNLSLICLLGINAFGENTGSSDTKDKTMLNLNVDAQYQTWVSGKLTTYVRAGVGYYKTLGSWSKPGISSGAGLEYHFSNKLGLNIGADYNHILKGLDFDLIPTSDFEKDVQFLQITLGLNFHF